MNIHLEMRAWDSMGVTAVCLTCPLSSGKMQAKPACLE